MRKRVIMCQWFCDKTDAVPNFLDNVWCSDEAHFLLSRHVNSKNNIFWGSTPPEHCLQRSLHSVKCTAWVAISKHGIIGPFWFEDDNERSVTINTERYVQVLGKFWTALGRRRGVVRVLRCFQQDGAIPPLLKRIIGMATAAFPWPTDQPQVWPAVVAAFAGLEPPDFYLWGYLKDRVYGNNPKTILELKAAITAAIRAIPREECWRVIENFARRIQMCLQRREAHLEHISWAPVKQRVFEVQT